MNNLELKVPPVLVLVIVGASMWLLAWLTPQLGLFMLPTVLRGVAIACIGAGTGFVLAGVRSFRKAETTVNPTTPDDSSSVVSTGIYRFTRNPMYVGMLFMLIGWAFYLSNGLAWLGIPAFILYMNRFQIAPEERALTAKFGDEYTHYRRRARRWL